MAQAQPEPEDKLQEKDMNMKETSSVVPFKFNAQAPEFVPRSQTQVPISGYYYPCFHLVGGSGGGSDWLYVGDQDPAHLISNPNVVLPNRSNSKTIHTNDLHQKIIKQVIGFDHDLGFFFFFLCGQVNHLFSLHTHLGNLYFICFRLFSIPIIIYHPELWPSG
jgi:hypothetical protein